MGIHTQEIQARAHLPLDLRMQTSEESRDLIGRAEPVRAFQVRRARSAQKIVEGAEFRPAGLERA